MTRDENGEQLRLFASLPVTGISWHRFPKAVGADYQLVVDGKPVAVWVCHCGHPTAIRPYYVEHATGVLERKFRLLADAQAAAIAAHKET